MPEARASLLLDFFILLGKFAFANTLSYCLPVAGPVNSPKRVGSVQSFILQPQLSKLHLTPSNILNPVIQVGEGACSYPK